MLEIHPSSRFKKDMKRIQKRGLNIALINDVINTLAAEKPLDEKHHDHQLKAIFLMIPMQSGFHTYRQIPHTVV